MDKFFRKYFKNIVRGSPTVSLIVIIVLWLIGITGYTDKNTILCVVSVWTIYSLLSGFISEAPKNKIPVNPALKGCFNKGGTEAKLFRKANMLFEGDSVVDALNLFKDINTDKLTNREKAVLSYYIGRCYQLTGYPANAAIAYGDAIDGGYPDDLVYIFAARCESFNKNYEKSLEYYNTLLENKTAIDYVYTDIGMMYLKANDGAKALEAFEKSIELNVNSTFAEGGCALAYLLMGELEKSKDFYNRALLNGVDDEEGFKQYYDEVAEICGVKLIKKEEL